MRLESERGWKMMVYIVIPGNMRDLDYKMCIGAAGTAQDRKTARLLKDL